MTPPASLVVTAPEPPGANCPSGGSVIAIGLDLNGNGVLDPDEVTSKSYVCDHVTLARVVPEPRGAHCANGGLAIELGIDLNGDSILEDAEVTTTSYVCNGAPSLVAVVPEAPGANCATGGQAIELGTDENGDGVLESVEVTARSYVCNGASSLTAVVPEAAGTNCANGGQAIEAGVDTNDDGMLEPGEVTSTSYVCNGAPGEVALVRVDPEPPGTNCSAGGSAVRVGLDANRDGILEDAEVQATTYLCGAPARPTVIDGDFVIRNSYDLWLLDGVTTISGNLEISSSSLSSISLPNLKQIGGNLECQTGNESCSTVQSLAVPALTAARSVSFVSDALTSIDLSALQGGSVSVGGFNASNTPIAITVSAFQSGTMTISLGPATLSLPSMVSGDIEDSDGGLQGLDAPLLAQGSVRLDSDWALTDLSLPRLTGGTVDVYQPRALQSLELPSMTSGQVFIDQAPSFISLAAPQLADGVVYVAGTSMQSVSLPALTHSDELYFASNSSLAAVSAPLLTGCQTVWVLNNPMFPTCTAQQLAAQCGATNVKISGNDDLATCP